MRENDSDGQFSNDFRYPMRENDNDGQFSNDFRYPMRENDNDDPRMILRYISNDWCLAPSINSVNIVK